jgi:hypothetical protein
LRLNLWQTDDRRRMLCTDEHGKDLMACSTILQSDPLLDDNCGLSSQH